MKVRLLQNYPNKYVYKCNLRKGEVTYLNKKWGNSNIFQISISTNATKVKRVVTTLN